LPEGCRKDDATVFELSPSSFVWHTAYSKFPIMLLSLTNN
jgi:hypothetical protein